MLHCCKPELFFIRVYRGPGACWQSAKMEEDAGNYLYNLVGILVHAGVAQGGHYYSYIRDRGRNAFQGGDGKPQVDVSINAAGNDNGSSIGIPLERGSSLGAGSVSSEGVDEGKVKCMFVGGVLKGGMIALAMTCPVRLFVIIHIQRRELPHQEL